MTVEQHQLALFLLHVRKVPFSFCWASCFWHMFALLVQMTTTSQKILLMIWLSSIRSWTLRLMTLLWFLLSFLFIVVIVLVFVLLQSLMIRGWLCLLVVVIVLVLTGLFWIGELWRCGVFTGKSGIVQAIFGVAKALEVVIAEEFFHHTNQFLHNEEVRALLTQPQEGREVIDWCGALLDSEL